MLLREDFQQDIPELLTRAKEGQKAVSAYFRAVEQLRATLDAFNDIGTTPPAAADTLPELADWYSRKIEVADQLVEQFDRLSIEGIDLAGAFSVKPDWGWMWLWRSCSYRQPVIDAGSHCRVRKSAGWMCATLAILLPRT